MKKPVQTAKAPAAIGPYSQGIIAGNLLFISGQLPLDPEKGKLVDGTMTEQTKQVLKNMTAVVEEAGGKLSDVVKTTIFLKDLKDFSEVNAAYADFFTDCPPARSTIQVAALPLDASIEIEAIVSLP
ncbi:MAG: RidA family protein [Desulfopila sp.]|jgi:2-iminobutanoate/2-iminopropanoate deaminase|nr:RidA family protein [Desulfopila sp.]